LADAFIVGRDFVGSASVALIHGDNIFYGHGLTELMAKATARAKGPTIFGYVVSDPERYGVLEMDAGGKVLSIEEKPKSNYAYDDQVVEIAAAIRPSGRGELEITDVNRAYLERGASHRFDVEILDRLRGPHQRRQVVDHGDLEHLTASGDDRVVPTACLERIFTPSMRSQDSVPFSAFSKISRVSMATLVSKLDV
jgi:NDP-sugar pyrophosphorylase family protein